MNTNKSLSARIKRRNKYGFVGVGNHTYKLSVSADYKDPYYNYKDEDRNEEQINIIGKLKKMFKRNKHIGSKTLKQLRKL